MTMETPSLDWLRDNPFIREDDHDIGDAPYERRVGLEHNVVYDAYAKAVWVTDEDFGDELLISISCFEELFKRMWEVYVSGVRNDDEIWEGGWENGDG